MGDTISVADVVLGCQLLVPWCCMLDAAHKDRWPWLRDHLATLWAMPEFEADLGGAVQALTEQFAARQGQSEQSP